MRVEPCRQARHRDTTAAIATDGSPFTTADRYRHLSQGEKNAAPLCRCWLDIKQAGVNATNCFVATAEVCGLVVRRRLWVGEPTRTDFWRSLTGILGW